MIKVIVVDDSAVVRQSFKAILDPISNIRLVATYNNPVFAIKEIENDWPDVIILDIEMPEMDGITFLKSVMKTRPTPVIICSTLATEGAKMTLEAMSAGAFDIIPKPTIGLKSHLASMSSELVNRIELAAESAVGAKPTATNNGDLKRVANELKLVQNHSAMANTTERIVAIGTSTGGTQALEVVLTKLPANAPALLIVQHMPESFTTAFAERLNRMCQITVKEAEDKERILPGHAYVAPGGLHMQIRRDGAYYYAIVKDGPLVSRHKPSVNVLFGSVAKHAGSNAIGFILTGMGDDGAKGMLDMRQAGAKTIAQSQESCVVFGMPKEAIKMGAVDTILSLDEIRRAIASINGIN